MIYLVNNKINSQIHLTNKGLYLQKFGTKSVHCRYTVSGIIGNQGEKKASIQTVLKHFRVGAIGFEPMTPCL